MAADSVSLGKVLRALRERHGLSRAQLALLVGAHPNQIQKLENGERKITVEWIERLAPHLDTNAEGFLAELRGPKLKAESPKNPPSPETSPPPGAVYLTQGWPRDLRVLGMAECGPDGWSLWNGEVIEMTSRPPNLAGSPLAYAVYVVGTSMEPRYFAGELAYVHPGKPVAIGDFVLVQVRPEAGEATPKAILKRLVKRSAARIVLEQYNPGKLTELKTRDVISVHQVVGSGKA
ncbi:MAG: helix-turn-helix domain-containing protein [Rhizomicrobium sp.]